MLPIKKIIDSLPICTHFDLLAENEQQIVKRWFYRAYAFLRADGQIEVDILTNETYIHENRKKVYNVLIIHWTRGTPDRPLYAQDRYQHAGHIDRHGIKAKGECIFPLEKMPKGLLCAILEECAAIDQYYSTAKA